MELIENLAGAAVFIAISSIFVTILIIVAILNTAKYTRQSVIRLETINEIMVIQIKNQEKILKSLSKIEELQIKNGKASIIQLNKIIEHNSRILSEQKEETTL